MNLNNFGTLVVVGLLSFNGYSQTKTTTVETSKAVETEEVKEEVDPRFEAIKAEMRSSPEERAKLNAFALAKKVRLSEEQLAEITDANLRSYKRFATVFDDLVKNPEEMIKVYESIELNRNNAINGILTQEQKDMLLKEERNGESQD